jgi:hypothetical protein
MLSDNIDTRVSELEQKLNTIRAHRLQFYRQATICVEDPTLQQIIQAIKK